MKKLAIVLVGLVMALPCFSQTKISGNIMPNVMKVDGEYLKMNGGGIREKFFLDLYVCVLYVEDKTSDANTVINDDKKMAIKIKVISGMVDNENFEEALREGFDKSTGGDISGVKDRMETMIAEGFKEDIKTNDFYDLVYVPGTGTTLYKNDKALVTVKGLDFKKALFGVWLCDEPADDDLKEDLLGK
jgi:hypothetical protein